LILPKAGQGPQADLTDQDGLAAISEAKTATPSLTTTSTSQPDYVPAVGDVVEHEVEKWQGIVFKHSCGALCVSDDTGEAKIYSNAETHALKKIGHTDLMDDVTEWGTKQRDAIKAYFSKIKDESSYVVAWSGCCRVGLAHRNNLGRMWYVCDCDCHFVNMEMIASEVVILESASIKPEDATKDDLRAIIAKYDMNTGGFKK